MTDIVRALFRCLTLYDSFRSKEVTIISSALDCVDIIALITGYYRLYIGKALAVQGDGYFHIPTDVLGSPYEEGSYFFVNSPK